MSKPNPADLIALAEHIIAATEAHHAKAVTIPTRFARALLEMAKRAPKPRGRQQVSGRDRVLEAMVVAEARSRKKQLIAQGMKKQAAQDQAAEEAVGKLGKRRNLAGSTIKRRME